MVAGDVMAVWEPGVGKTFPVLCASEFIDGPLLCIVPAHLRLQWLEKAKEFAPLRRATILSNTKEKIKPGTLAAYDIFIVSYEFASVLPRWKELRQRHWGALAIDEAHYLTNLDANRSRAILGRLASERMGLVFAADRVWYLTGTPFQFPNQIYPILASTFPDAIRRDPKEGPGLMTAREWENKFCIVRDVIDERSGKSFGVKVCGAKNIPELRERLAPFLDKQKLDLPVTLDLDFIPMEGTLRQLTKDLPEETLQLYEALTSLLINDRIPDEDKLDALEEHGLVMAQLRHVIAATKVSMTAEIVRNELLSGQKKLLIFGWHREPLAALSKQLKAPLIFGGISDKRKEETKRDFIAGDVPVLVGQIGAMGTGTDGLQEVCHRAIFMEMSWAYRDNKQAWHRIYRTGQDKPCHVSFVTLLGSIDEYVVRTFKRNAEIIKSVLD